MSENLIYLASFFWVRSLVGTTVSSCELLVTESRDYDEDGIQSDQGFMNLPYLKYILTQSE